MRTHTTRRRFLTKSVAGCAATLLAGRNCTTRGSQRPATNPSIEQARAAAVAVLKPSEMDLEHGLALHASSIVFDAYGFSPNAAVDGDVLARAVADGASDIELQDLTEDQRFTLSKPTKEMLGQMPPQAKAGLVSFLKTIASDTPTKDKKMDPNNFLQMQQAFRAEYTRRYDRWKEINKIEDKTNIAAEQLREPQ